MEATRKSLQDFEATCSCNHDQIQSDKEKELQEAMENLKKQNKGKYKEVKGLKVEVVKYKENLEISLAELNSAKNEKRQLFNYLDDVKKLIRI